MNEAFRFANNKIPQRRFDALKAKLEMCLSIRLQVPVHKALMTCTGQRELQRELASGSRVLSSSCERVISGDAIPLSYAIQKRLLRVKHKDMYVKAVNHPASLNIKFQYQNLSSNPSLQNYACHIEKAE